MFVSEAGSRNAVLVERDVPEFRRDLTAGRRSYASRLAIPVADLRNGADPDVGNVSRGKVVVLLVRLVSALQG
jgi:hypothetical protein